MFEVTRLFMIAGISLCLSLVGCHNDDHDHAPPATDAGTNHDHGDHDHGDHDHGDHDHSDHDHLNAGPLPDSGPHTDAHAEDWLSLGTVTIAGATLDVSRGGVVAPNTEMHISIVQTAGPTLHTLRLWIGDEAATGSLKAKSDAHEGHFHAHVETPEQLAKGAELWLEAQRDGGIRERSSLPL